MCIHLSCLNHIWIPKYSLCLEQKNAKHCQRINFYWQSYIYINLSYTCISYKCLHLPFKVSIIYSQDVHTHILWFSYPLKDITLNQLFSMKSTQFHLMMFQGYNDIDLHTDNENTETTREAPRLSHNKARLRRRPSSINTLMVHRTDFLPPISSNNDVIRCPVYSPL